MIKFKAKNFSEYDAMRNLYVELMKYSDKNRFGIIDTSALIPILRGNNVVIERFVISSSFFGRDKYRMYLKIGAKASLPDEVRLPEKVYDKRLANAQLNFNGSIFPSKPEYQGGGGGGKREDSDTSLGDTTPPKPAHKPKTTTYSSILPGSVMTKCFGTNNNNNKKDKQYPFASAQLSPGIDISYEVRELLGEAIKYDKKSRSLVLEFASIQDAIRALNILPFGLGYKIYLLGA